MALSDDELTTVLDLLFSHRMDWIQEFLKAQPGRLKVSGKKEELRKRVENYIAESKISGEQLVSLLDRIEGWGNQHIYLYNADDSLIASLSDERQIKASLKKRGCAELFNRPTPLILPEDPTLSVVEWDEHHVRFVWIEKRRWRKPIPDENRREDELEFDAFRPMTSRGIVSFRCDLTSAFAELMIQRPIISNRRSLATGACVRLSVFRGQFHAAPLRDSQ